MRPLDRVVFGLRDGGQPVAGGKRGEADLVPRQEGLVDAAYYDQGGVGRKGQEQQDGPQEGNPGGPTVATRNRGAAWGRRMGTAP